MQSFFFFKMTDLSSNIFSDDLKVANYWFNLPLDQKMKQLESLETIGTDLLRTYNEQKQSMDKLKDIDEEENSSMSDMNSNAEESDDFSMEPKYKGRKKIGALNPRLKMVHEYAEYEQDRLPSETMIV